MLSVSKSNADKPLGHVVLLDRGSGEDWSLVPNKVKRAIPKAEGDLDWFYRNFGEHAIAIASRTGVSSRSKPVSEVISCAREDLVELGFSVSVVSIDMPAEVIDPFTRNPLKAVRKVIDYDQDVELFVELTTAHRKMIHELLGWLEDETSGINLVLDLNTFEDESGNRPDFANLISGYRGDNDQLTDRAMVVRAHDSLEGFIEAGNPQFNFLHNFPTHSDELGYEKDISDKVFGRYMRFDMPARLFERGVRDKVSEPIKMYARVVTDLVFDSITPM